MGTTRPAAMDLRRERQRVRMTTRRRATFTPDAALEEQIETTRRAGAVPISRAQCLSAAALLGLPLLRLALRGETRPEERALALRRMFPDVEIRLDADGRIIVDPS